MPITFVINNQEKSLQSDLDRFCAFFNLIEKNKQAEVAQIN
jgi:hypothetical protein